MVGVLCVYDCGWSPVKRERRVFPDPVNDKEISWCM